ncbi:MAG: hypothetical protein IH968_17240, partial [Gemmatimonadetes bacterium]|nr:hypothetical protein [Gemmatimonadota bacterium]
AAELRERVCDLLWECDDREYMDYLRRYCAGIVGRFDGSAISRLRHRLVEVMEAGGQREER